MLDINQKQAPAVLQTRVLSVDYPAGRALHEVSLSFEAARVHALIGPSGCGKSTFLRSLNLMNWEIPGCVVRGDILYHGEHINDPRVDIYDVRTHIGMVFQQPTPFSMSIWDNIAFPLARHGMKDKDEIEKRVVQALKQAYIWDEVKDSLKKHAYGLSGGQQQRLCIARSLVLQPDVLLMDEPASALDPIATLKIEETIKEIARAGTLIVIVTHNMEQAARISDTTSFFWLGNLLEHKPSAELFADPKHPQLKAYLSGKVA